MLQVGWGGIFFKGGFLAWLLPLLVETQLRVYRGRNEMKAAYLGNHISPQGRRIFEFRGTKIHW
jgi:hypothetical protein